MSIKYCVTITVRDVKSNFVQSSYVEHKNIQSLNTYLFETICNTKNNYEIIGLYFEVVNC